ncbi:MAG: ADP-glyceromanno-heptose 6-epimerase [Melioribacteraceae bacterium]|nr:ADP-glyceromanno-heptose 6-epimerase [Melioribacteraceae bacterium]MCF8353922.1 ADP-glyceromanno-heptose 6-epimerase [Melioribacteraceae bacterium]MCF8392679.1 ADP-glyceromanno-heptose 6-epimerase [Melioribacteraceae bacterium]MCF8417700.1 ADP-glyceromanno-heptose 6-epimerase [Melioribacteraceae bacterium]
MIVVTGGAGFIGSAVVWRLNQMGIDEIIIVDRLGEGEKWKNLNGLHYSDIIHKDDFIDMILDDDIDFYIDSIIHLGACSSTTERDADYLLYNNFKYSQALAEYSIENHIRFIYASSAATYGAGENGYRDDELNSGKLRPLNMYGYSKQMFDMWVINNSLVDQVVGLKYFNVYGPNEYHKADMRSVVHKAFEQVMNEGKVKLFKSYNDKYGDGEQMRDFIYVKDAVDMTLYFYENREKNGIYNIGTGSARTWNDLVTALFKAVDKPVNIEYIEMPGYLKPKYQYFTEAELDKLRNAGYNNEITSIEDGVKDYVQNYLLKNEYLGW